MLERLAEPDSASGLARKLNLPRQQVNYHLRELEREGFVKLVEERRKGNCIERLVRATARSYLISPEALGKLGRDPGEQRDRFSASYLVATAARAIEDLAVLGVRASKEGKRLSTLTLVTEIRFRSPAQRNAFAEDLSNTLLELLSKYHDEKAPEGRWFRFLAGAYPAITKQEDDAEDSAEVE